MRKLECPICDSDDLVKREYVETLMTYDLDITEEGNEPGDKLEEELTMNVTEEFGECLNCYSRFGVNDIGGINLNNVIEKRA